MPNALLIIGNDTAAAQRSAKRAGFEAIVVPTRELPKALRAMADAPPDAPVVVTLDAIDQTSLLDAAAMERRMLTPASESVAVLRDAATLRSLPKFRGLRQSPGWFGSLVRKVLRREEPTGEPIDAVFVADGWSARLLGAVVSDSEPPRLAALSEGQRAALSHVAVVLTQRHDTRGLFGVHALAHGSRRITPRRIDPAFTNAMDALETLTNVRAIGEANRAVKMRK